jgi:MFS-type transporter involved in bile tolerance (Atg22 family)
MKFIIPLAGLVAGAITVLLAVEPVTLTEKLTCIIVGGGAGAKFSESLEAEFYRLFSLFKKLRHASELFIFLYQRSRVKLIKE